MSFQEFSKQFMRGQCRDYYKRFWAGTAIESGLTIKFDNKEVLVSIEDIHMTDLGEMSGNCMCGHAIRYEYWFKDIGPIGSKCIQTMTGLSGQDLRAILRGGQEAKRDLDELVLVKERYQTLTKQRQEDKILDERLNILHEKDIVPEKIQKFIEEDIPMPNSVKRLVDSLWHKSWKENDLSVKYGQAMIDDLNYSSEVVPELEAILHPHIGILVGSEKPIYATIRDINNKIRTQAPSEKSIEYFKKLVQKIRNPKFVDAVDVLTKLDGKKLDEFWQKVVKDNLKTAIQYGLTDKQIEFILYNTSTGKPGLAVRFAKLLNEVEEVVEPVKEEIVEDEAEKVGEYTTTEFGDEPTPKERKVLPDGENPF